VPEDEFVEVDLELCLAHSVVGADQPLLEVANGSIRKWDSGLHAFAQLRPQGLVANHMLKAGLLSNSPSEKSTSTKA
jgi:hypothetical protein